MANPRESKPVLHTKKHIARLERERRQTRLILAGFIGILVIVVGMLDLRLRGYEVPAARGDPWPRLAMSDISIAEWQARVRMERAPDQSDCSSMSSTSSTWAWI